LTISYWSDGGCAIGYPLISQVILACVRGFVEMSDGVKFILRRLPSLFRANTLGWCFFLLVSIFINVESRAFAAPARVVSSIGELNSIRNDDYDRGIVVRILADMTYGDNESKQLFIQDSTGSLYISTKDAPTLIPMADKVLIEGITGLSNKKRIIRRLRTQAVDGKSALMPQAVNRLGLLDRTNNARLVRISGVVKSIVPDDRLSLEVEIEGQLFHSTLRNYLASDLTELLGATVSMDAVCWQKSDDMGRIMNVRLLANGFRNVRVERKGIKDPFAYEKVSIKQMLEMGGTNNARVRTVGIVVTWQPGESMGVCDGTGTIRVISAHTFLNPIDAQVELSGVVRKIDGEVCLTEIVERETPSPLKRGSGVSGGLPLVQLSQIHAMPEEEIMRNPSKRVRGVVTYYDSFYQNLFITDETNGMYVGTISAMGLKPGTLIEAIGIVKTGNGYPYITHSEIKILGTGSLPEPVHLTYESGCAGTNDCRWSRILGTVKRVEQRGSLYYLTMTAVNGKTFGAWLAHLNDPGFLVDLVQTRVSICGVCANETDENHHLNGFSLRVQDESFITKLGPVKEVACSVKKLRGCSPNDAFRYQIRGVVTLTRTNGFYLQDKTGGIWVASSYFAQIVALGEEVEAVGTLSVADFAPWLDNATVKPLGRLGSVPVLTTTALSLLKGEDEGRLVTIKARLLENVSSTNDAQYLVQDGGTVVLVSRTGILVNVVFPPMREGSFIKLTGVCTLNRINATEVKSCNLLLRSPEDVVILTAPPAGVSWKRVILFSLIPFCLLVAGVVWVLSLRRQVRLQTQQISRRLEHEAALEARLLQSQKMESIGQLAAGVAHDFNNLLTVIQGYASMFVAENGSSEEAVHSAKAIVQASNRGADLTRQLLAYSRQHPMQLCVLNLNDNIKSLADLLRRLLGENVAVKFIPEPNLPSIKGDEGMIQQIIMNLAVNARDAMPGGGILEIRTFVRNFVKKTDSLREPSGSYVCLSVRDNGKGMTEEIRKRIFEPFFTTKDVGKGTGLGLAMVYGIVQQHGGWIDVTSEMGKGALFEVYFPVFAESAEEVGDAESEEDSQPMPVLQGARH